MANNAITRAFRAEEQRGVQLATRVRLIGLGIIGVWVLLENPWPGGVILQVYPLAFALNTLINDRLQRRDAPPAIWPYLFPLIDAAIIATAISAPTPGYGEQLPLPLRLGFGNSLYFFLIVTASVFTYSPRLVMWTGIACAMVWTGTNLVVMSLPDTLVSTAGLDRQAMDIDSLARAITDPNRILVGALIRENLVMLLTGAALAVLVLRLRRLVHQQASAERARSNLARYFSPNLVDELAGRDLPLTKARTQDVAVMFVDIVGFTEFAEDLEPDRLIALLRQFHGRLSEALFAHGGTLEKFTGDGIMATFGTPRPGEADAANAVAAAGAMFAAIDNWNAERRRIGAPTIDIAIGAHYGPVVLGDVGDRNQLEFAVLGDTVNVASRLERLTRKLEARIAISGDLADAARAQAGEELLDAYRPAAAQSLRGRGAAVDVWLIPRNPA